MKLLTKIAISVGTAYVSEKIYDAIFDRNKEIERSLRDQATVKRLSKLAKK